MFAFLRRCVIWVLLLTFAQQPAARGGQQNPPPGQPIRIGSEEVLLDVIARDKKGRPVRDLKPEELEIYEDGVRQTLASFRLIEAGADTAGAANEAARAKEGAGYEIDSSRQINLVTMVFDNLDVNGRRLARDAALDFINTGMRANVMVAVFVVNHRFYVLQSFTADREKLRQAVEAATGRAEKQYADVSQKIVEQLQIIANAPDFGPPAGVPNQNSNQAAGAPTGLAATGMAPTGIGVGASPAEKAVAQITLSTLRAVEAAQLDQQARASIYTFMHIAREQRRLNGRKTVLYFSNGLQVPTHLTDAMRTTISEANRANVSIYAIDARGLTSEVEGDRARRMMAMAIMGSREAAKDGPASISGGADSFKSSEYAENSLRMNKQGTLAELAEGTGGFLVANTNDLRGPLKRVASELSSYYAVSYSPIARELDGKFRKITVNILRPDVKAQTRSGYFAVPLADGKPVMAFEMPMLAAANSVKPPHDFPHRAAAFRFGADAMGAKQALLMEVPLSEITFKTDAAKKTYSARFSVLALVKNEKGEIARRVSQDYPIQGNLERLQSLKKGVLDFTQTLSLPPGRYVLETIVHDAEANKTSVQRGDLTAPAGGAGVAVSSLAIIKRIDPSRPSGTGEDIPLMTPSGRIVPNLGEIITAGPKTTLSFYLVIYPQTGSQDRPQLTIELLLNGEVISRGEAEAPAPDDKGRITYMAGVPTASLRSGAYEIRVIVKQGAAQSEERASFAINNPDYVAGSEATVVKATKPATGPTAPAEAPSPSLATPVESFGISEAVLAASKAMRESNAAAAAAVNIPDLLSEAEKSGVAMYQSMLEYTYQLRKVRRVLNETGQVIKEEFQDYEAYPARGRHVLIQIANAGKPLPNWEVENERKRAGEELERAEREAANAIATLQPPSPQSYPTASVAGSYYGKHAALLIDPTVFLRACEYSDPRHETIGGREMIALDFTPRQGMDLPLATSFVSKLTGTIWIDATDRTLARLEARQARPGIGKNGKPLPLSPEPKLIYQQMRLPSGSWVPSVIRMNAAGEASA
ncbi:MAG TPA: VWA domain-containing protein, partial [Blastocatellia bacterium]|nr:VWA domain-containing protein [Blastocatellia bacterium]